MAIVGWILLALIGLVLLFLLVPVRVRVSYEQEWECRVWLFGVIPVYVYTPAKIESAKPRDKAADKRTENKTDKPSLMSELKTMYEQDGIGGVAAFLTKLLHIVKRLVIGAVRAVTIRQLKLLVRIGGEADEVAVNYGRVQAVLQPTLTALSHAVRIRKRQVQIEPQFLAEDHAVSLTMMVWVWPFAAVGAALAALCRLITVWVKHMPASSETTNTMPTSASES